MTDRHYTHVYEALEGKPFVSMAQMVAEARAEVGVSSECPDATAVGPSASTQAALNAA